MKKIGGRKAVEKPGQNRAWKSQGAIPTFPQLRRRRELPLTTLIILWRIQLPASLRSDTVHIDPGILITISPESRSPSPESNKARGFLAPASKFIATLLCDDLRKRCVEPSPIVFRVPGTACVRI